MPQSTDLVTDLPADFEVFGQAVATSMADLLGGTSGQILAKNSNTDMDFVWTTPNPGDITGVTAGVGISGGGTSGDVTITNSMATEITAKGDLIVGTGSATFDNLAAGANGSTIVADSSTSTGLAYQANWAAGKNKIINGDFFINQRNFSSTTTNTYTLDRWTTVLDGVGATYSVQQFTAGTAPVSGYEAKQYMQIVTTGQSSTSTYTLLEQNIESVRTFAGQTATISFWAKSASGTPKIALEIQQNFGTSGSAGVNTYISQATISTSWTRYTATVAVPSISGKTVGTASDYLALNFWVSAGSVLNSRTGSLGIQSNTFSIWGVQFEAGSVATAFQTATGTLQGELAAAQRYYYRFVPFAGSGGNYYGPYAVGGATSTTNAYVTGHIPVAMRSAPTFNRSGSQIYNSASNIAVTALGNAWATGTSFSINVTVASGLTAGQVCHFAANNNSADYFDLSAEL